MAWNKKRAIWSILSALTLIVLVVSTLPSKQAYAAQITSRSLTLQAGATDGGSKPGGTVNHLFTFTVPTTGNVGSIQFLYCTTAAGSCTTPTGLTTTSATLGSQSGASFTSLVNTTNGSPYVSRTAASVSSGTSISIQLQSVVNPSGANTAFYVRISTFASTDTTGSATDTGTVAASTATQITLTGTMPESLIFCTGATISTASGIPDCTTATPGSINFNQFFSPTDTATATSQLAASTNAVSGYNITVNGATLSNGSTTIAAMGSATTGVRGTSQFGMNLKANTTATSTTPVGTEVAPAANGTNYKGQALSGYNTADTFKFVSGDSIANSANGGAGPTDAQIFTVAYMVNVSGSQLAGTYTTTLTYICTPTF